MMTVPLSRLRVLLDPSDPCELLVIAPDDHPMRGPVLAWLREHAHEHTSASRIEPIMMGAYVMGWRVGVAHDNLDALARAIKARFGIVWCTSVVDPEVWIGDLP